jgi:thiol-disulfide isomerase/thioredoxin
MTNFFDMLHKIQVKLIFLLIPILIPLTFTKCQGYEIGIKINGIQDTTIILAHYYNKTIYPDDTIRLDSHGKAKFKGKKSLPEGLYVVYLPTSKYFEIIMGKNQNFSIESDTSNLIEHLKVQGSTENDIFYDFQRYMIDKKNELSEYQKNFKSAVNELEKTKFRNDIENINNERINKIKTINSQHPDLFVSTFLKATLDIEVPDPPKDKNGKIDSTWQYYYYRHHYFDNFNISDPRMLRTPLYEDKVMNYLEKVIPHYTDTINKEVDMIIDTTRHDSTLFRFMLVTLFNYYGKSQIMGMDAVQVHIAEKYYISDAWWSDKKFIDDLKERVTALKPLLLGKVAPDVQLRIIPAQHFIEAATDTALKKYPHAGSFLNLSQIEAKYTVLIFWEATCGHCKVAVPKMYQIYKDSLEKMGVKVVAISTLFGEDGKVEWVNFVNQHKLYDWINAWNPYDYQFKIIYDIKSTPQIFVLNKNKEIIGKRIGPENVVDLINAYSKQYPGK